MKTTFQIHPEYGSWFRVLLLAALLLGTGALIYFWFRPGEAGFLQYIPGIIAGTGRAAGLLPDWLIYSLPSGIWAMAYTLVITRIWQGQTGPYRFTWYFSVPVLTFGHEFCQLRGILPGTFCPIDLLAGSLGILVGIWVSVRMSARVNRKVVRQAGNTS